MWKGLVQSFILKLNRCIDTTFIKKSIQIDLQTLHKSCLLSWYSWYSLHCQLCMTLSEKVRAQVKTIGTSRYMHLGICANILLNYIEMGWSNFEVSFEPAFTNTFLVWKVAEWGLCADFGGKSTIVCWYVLHVEKAITVCQRG